LRSGFPPPRDIALGINGDVIAKAMPYTMTSAERMFSLCEAVRYVVTNGIPGDIVECGVWKGGSMLAVALTLVNLNSMEKNIYLFDTFEGMSTPGNNDVYDNGKPAFQLLKEDSSDDEKSAWCCVSIERVRSVMFSSGYDKDKIHFIKGRVEDTLPRFAPSDISILRLDTDFYQSTCCELEHLFGRISHRGVIIVDDYGSWKGVREAWDEFIRKNKVNILMNRIDYSGRIGVVIKERGF